MSVSKDKLQVCGECGTVLDVSNANKDNRYDRFQYWCKSCASEYGKEYRRKNAQQLREKDRMYWERNKYRFKDDAARRHVMRKYGLSPEQVDLMRAAQGWLCAICRVADIEVVDHCHTTGTVRALLCRNCNLLLGHAKEDPKTLRDAANYLEKYE